MKARKVIHDSPILGRPFHVDLFLGGEEPAWMVLLFGGSGVSKETYERRFETIHPELAKALPAILRIHPTACLAHVTAPYDVPYAHFGRDSDAIDEAMDNWNDHVEHELLSVLPDVPFVVCGFSGGAHLALCGPQDLPACIGAATLAGDGYFDWLQSVGGHPILAIYNKGDRVRGQNTRQLLGLAQEGVVKEMVVGDAEHGHRMADYAASGALQLLFTVAAEALG